MKGGNSLGKGAAGEESKGAGKPEEFIIGEVEDVCFVEVCAFAALSEKDESDRCRTVYQTNRWRTGRSNRTTHNYGLLGGRLPLLFGYVNYPPFYFGLVQFVTSNEKSFKSFSLSLSLSCFVFLFFSALCLSLSWFIIRYTAVLGKFWEPHRVSPDALNLPSFFYFCQIYRDDFTCPAYATVQSVEIQTVYVWKRKRESKREKESRKKGDRAAP